MTIIPHITLGVGLLDRVIFYVDSNGRVRAWGNNKERLCDIPHALPPVQKIVSARDYAIALCVDGTIKAWGRGSKNLVTTHTNLRDITPKFGITHAGQVVRLEPFQVIQIPVKTSENIWYSKQFTDNMPAVFDKSVIKLWELNDYVYAIHPDGTMTSWQESYRATPNDRAIIVPDDLPLLKNFTTHVKLYNDGRLIGWNSDTMVAKIAAVPYSDFVDINSHVGVRTNGEIIPLPNDNGTLNPLHNIPDGLNHVTCVVTDDDSVAALTHDGQIIVWGKRPRDIYSNNIPLPTNDPNIVDFAAGDNVVVIRYVDGTIKVWDTATSPESSTVVAPYTIATPPTAIHKIAAGQVFDPPSLWNRYHALLDTSGVIQIAQPQSEGEFANTTIANLIPASLQGQATDIFILEQGLYAVHANGNVYAINHEAATIIDCKSNPIYIGGGLCRGTHAEDVFYTVFLYQDGTISVDGPPMYQPPANLPNIKAISASSSHTLALLHDGQVVAWGDNQLGACNVPADLANVVAITAGEDYSVALLADGTIRGWGENGEGQYAFPADLPKVRQVKAAIYQTYVLTESGSVIKSHHPTHFDVPEDLRV